MKKQLLLAALAIGCTSGVFAQMKLDIAGRATMRAAQHSLEKSSPQASILSHKGIESHAESYGVWIKLAPGHNQAEIEDIEGLEIKMQAGNTVLACATTDAIQALDSSRAVVSIKMEQRVNQKLDRARALSNIDFIHQGKDLPQPYTGKGVLAGIVDGGFDPNHVNFKNADGTSRIENFCYFRKSGENYNQENYGADYIPQIDTENSSTFHGTHTLGIMAGGYRGKITAGQLVQDPDDPRYAIPQVSEIDNPWYGVAYDAGLNVACGAETDMLMALGIADLVNYANYVAHTTGEVHPLVINLSLGSNIGPHDGSSTLCQFIDRIVNYELTEEEIAAGEVLVPVTVVVSAGNEGDLPIAAHKTFTDSDDELKIGFKSLYPDAFHDSNGDVMLNPLLGGVYIYSDTAEPFESVQAVIVNKSRGREAIRVALPIEEAATNENGAALYYVTDSGYIVDSSTDQVNNQLARNFNGYLGVGGMVDKLESGRFYSVIDIFLYDTATNNDQYVAGLYVKGKPGQRVDVFTSGDYFVLDDQDLADSGYIGGDTDGSINDIATAKTAVAVGSYNCRDYWTSVDGKIYMYEQFDNTGVSSFSSYGTLIDGRQLPHVCAPGATIISSSNEYYIQDNKVKDNAIQGTLQQDGRRYSWHQCVGTSMSAPLVSGAIALWYEANPNLTNDDIHNIIKKTSRVDDDVKAGNPVQWGAGKFDAYAGIQEALRLVSVDKISADDNEVKLMARYIDSNNLEVSLPGVKSIKADLYDLTGRLVATVKEAADTAVINLGSIGSGLYIVRVNDSQSIKITI